MVQVWTTDRLPDPPARWPSELRLHPVRRDHQAVAGTPRVSLPHRPAQVVACADRGTPSRRCPALTPPPAPAPLDPAHPDLGRWQSATRSH
ncbi:hypothetical protein TH66_18810 [Carbonactinospora thermoautotrophica]|uniref:Uncharacterized protein n=1 Tax=Carbonactinospora thermoautotrophica TaxID=1469144 RepID=A0A132MIE7_9ACTN|nr:hypothetical protein TH66_18810 [Carbonactinospora thermoautotrophica]